MNPADRLVSENTTTEEALTGGVAHQAQDRVTEPATDPADGLRGRAAPVPPRAGAAPQTPAGTGRGAAPPVPAGPGEPRTWTLELPAGLKLLSLNGREHWAERARRSKTLKNAAWAMALAGKVPHLERASIVVEYRPPDRRRRDADNPAPSAKACIDGIVAAGVLTDDACPQYVTEIRCTIGELYPCGRLVLHVTEERTEPGDPA